MLNALCHRCPIGRRVLPAFQIGLTRTFSVRATGKLQPTKLMRIWRAKSAVAGKNNNDKQDAGRLEEPQYQREMLLAKAFYTTSSMSGVFLLPYLVRGKKSICPSK
ncbi:hypothetical protein DUNSADRAFT_9510 [Dunaliella salina]|uniref:Uncharacterized protein n=1 Tax=Dunaliella salina TaxID=3046 RepID=A0ABQ7GHB2_DUNSA|nr:hypothetical protein DUNSADRAFT_9510 [Dunaliella salina]|eukprot:KAF5833984.1 hypothetical protein DUNSADRAFT_9510 [Dunaliella salina]